MSKEPLFSRIYPNLASASLGARIISVSDEFFAATPRMLSDSSPVFLPDKYDDNGKWMDGWETKRRRDGKYDWCVIKLAAPCSAQGLLVDTAHFTGNYPQAVEVEQCLMTDDNEPAPQWRPLLAKTPLSPDSKHYFPLPASTSSISHLRVNIYPDGGIARLKFFGKAQGKARKIRGLDEVSGLLIGGRVIDWNDSHFGPPGVVLKPDRALSMQDGWETRRRRTAGYDWLVVRLPHACEIKSIEVDTAYFKGNFPQACSVQAGGTKTYQKKLSTAWPELLPQTPLRAHRRHIFTRAIKTTISPIHHVRLNIYPDGGISRFRLLGKFIG